MKIGFDISQTGNNKAGCGFYAENLISHLAEADTNNQYLLYSTFGNHYWDPQYRRIRCNKPSNFQQQAMHTNLEDAKQFWANPPYDLEARLGSVDVVHANNYFCPPKLKNSKIVYTLYDLSFLEHPDYTTEHNRIACFDGVFQASLQADAIIAISQFTRDHFLKIFPHFPEDKISVIYPASRFDNTQIAVKQTKKLAHLKTDQFWLTVGTLEPRKNITFLLQTYAQLKQQQAVLPLVLAGQQGWMIDDLKNLLQELNITNDVHVLGYVDNAELLWLYQHCLALVYPSLFEGFGLPILEAMSVGAAVIASNASSIPEVVGDAGIMIDPNDKEALQLAMIKLESNTLYRKALKELALKQAKCFSWKDTAQKTLRLYESLL